MTVEEGIKAVGRGAHAEYGRVVQGLKDAASNDLGSVRRLLKEWPEDVYITARGIDALPLSEPAKAVLIFKQMERLSPRSFILHSFASSLADVFTKAAVNDCQSLSGDWWIGLNDSKAHLRIKGELPADHTMQAPQTWRDHDLEIITWSPYGMVQCHLRPKNPASGAPVRVQVDARDDSDVKIHVVLYAKTGVPIGSGHERKIEIVPTEMLEILKRGLTPFLPEKAENLELRELRQKAEEEKEGSVKPAIAAIQKVLDHRKKALDKAQELLDGASAKNVGRRTKERLGKLADEAVNPESLVEETA
ncbi:hypothetical protein ACFL6C_12510 [Myxococcota bacterium]